MLRTLPLAFGIATFLLVGCGETRHADDGWPPEDDDGDERSFSDALDEIQRVATPDSKPGADDTSTEIGGPTGDDDSEPAPDDSAEECPDGDCDGPPEQPDDDDADDAPDACPSGDGLYCGGNGVDGDDDRLYRCEDGELDEVEHCDEECVVAPPGTDDYCAFSGGSADECPSGNGYYCGGNGIDGDDDTLYRCDDGDVDEVEECDDGCVVAPPGVDDYCRSSSSGGDCPSGNGRYCGGNGVSGDESTLYDCDGGSLTPVRRCDNGCVSAPAGTDDYCRPGGGGGDYDECSDAGAAALGWEAEQLSCCANEWRSWCLRFVRLAYEHAGVDVAQIHAPDAATALDQFRGADMLSGGDPPCGAIVFWPATSHNNWWGHVAIANGDGTVSTSGWNGFAGDTNASIDWVSGQEGAGVAGWYRP